MIKYITLLLDHPVRDIFEYCSISEQLSKGYKNDFQVWHFAHSGPNFFKRVNKNEKVLITTPCHVLRTPNILLRKKKHKLQILSYK